MDILYSADLRISKNRIMDIQKLIYGYPKIELWISKNRIMDIHKWGIKSKMAPHIFHHLLHKNICFGKQYKKRFIKNRSKFWSNIDKDWTRHKPNHRNCYLFVHALNCFLIIYFVHKQIKCETNSTLTKPTMWHMRPTMSDVRSVLNYHFFLYVCHFHLPQYAICCNLNHDGKLPNGHTLYSLDLACTLCGHHSK